MQNDQLANRIWDRHTKRAARHRRVLSLGGTGLALALVGSATLWPRPALAFQDMTKATLKFKSISWKQLDEGTVRDMGSSNPATVPHFKYVIHHYAKIDPPDLQQRVEPSKTWMGMHKFEMLVPFKHKDGSIKKVMSPGFGYKPGPSKGVTEEDLRWNITQFINFEGYFPKDHKPEETEYKGRRAVKFHSRQEGKHIVRDDTILADPNTKRMIYRRFEVTRPTGERLFLREQSDFVYDGPRPG